MPPESTLPEWWNWELSFTAHAELRMEQRGVTDAHRQRPWIVIVEPDVDAKLLVVVTPYEVSQ